MDLCVLVSVCYVACWDRCGEGLVCIGFCMLCSMLG